MTSPRGRDFTHLRVQVGGNNAHGAGGVARPLGNAERQVGGTGGHIQNAGCLGGQQPMPQVLHDGSLSAQPAVHRGNVTETLLQLGSIVLRRVQQLARRDRTRQRFHASCARGGCSSYGSTCATTSRAPTAEAISCSTASA